MRQTWMAQLILAISLCGMSLFILKVFYYSYAWFCSLSEGRTSFFCTRLFNRKLSVNSYFCFQLALLHSVSYFFSLYQSPSLPSCKVSDAISSNIDEVLLINLFPNVFVFVIHHKDWLTWWNWQTWWTLLKFFYLKWPYSDGWLSYSDPCDSRTPAPMLWIFSFFWRYYLCYTMAFSPFKNFDYCCLSFHWLSIKLKTILVLIGMVFVLISEMFHEMISLNLMFLRLFDWSLNLFYEVSFSWYCFGSL